MTQTASPPSGPGPGLLPGAQRIALVGITGTGKTVLADALAQRLNIPHLELDAWYWGPNWTVRPMAEFRAAVDQATVEPSWIADGSHSEVRDIIWPRATTLVWLDYQLSVVIWQLFKRTGRRIVSREELWSGNRETWRDHILSRRLGPTRGHGALTETTTPEDPGGATASPGGFVSALRSLFTAHERHRGTFERLLTQPEHAHLAVVRLRSPQEAEEWLAAVKQYP